MHNMRHKYKRALIKVVGVLIHHPHTAAPTQRRQADTVVLRSTGYPSPLFDWRVVQRLSVDSHVSTKQHAYRQCRALARLHAAQIAVEDCVW